MDARIARVVLLGNSQIRSPRDLKYGSSIGNRSTSDRVATFDDSRPRHSPATVTPPPPPEEKPPVTPPPPEEKPSVTSTTPTPNTSEQEQRHSSSPRHSSTNAVVATTLNFSTGVANVLPSHDDSTTTESSSAVPLLDSFGFNHSETDVPFCDRRRPFQLHRFFFPEKTLRWSRWDRRNNRWIIILELALGVFNWFFSNYERTLDLRLGFSLLANHFCGLYLMRFRIFFLLFFRSVLVSFCLAFLVFFFLFIFSFLLRVPL